MIYFTREEVERIGKAGSSLWVSPDGEAGSAFRYLSSFWLLVEDQDEAFTPHGPDGFWEAWITRWISEKLQDADLFIDVGANVGYYTLMAAAAGVQTFAFEPNPDLCKMIERSTKINRVGSRVEIFQQALSDKKGTAFLNVPERHSGGAYLSEDRGEYVVSHEVPMDTLDNSALRLSTSNVLIKIDAEGAEPKIWAGMQDWYQRHNCTVVLEWESSRFDCEAFGKSLFDDYKNYVAVVDFEGHEKEMTHWRQLAMRDGLEMVVVRKRV